MNPWGSFGDRDGMYFPDRPFAVSWCWPDGEMGYIRFYVDPHTRKVCYDRKPKAVAYIQELLDDPDTVKVFHNANFDVAMLTLAGWKIRGQIVDTKTMAHIATHGAERTYGLKELSDKLFDYPQDDQKELHASTMAGRRYAKAQGWRIAVKETHGKSPLHADYWLADNAICKKYAMQDAERTTLMAQFFWPMICDDPDKMRVFERETLLYQGAIREIESTGMRVFPKEVDRLEAFYTEYSAEQRRTMDELGYEGFNPKSVPQKKKVFIEEMGLEILSRTKKTKQPQVNGEFLQYHAPRVPLAHAALEFINSEGAISGFLKQYRHHWCQEQKGIYILHPWVRHTGTKTGRMSCADPNLMNVASATTGRRRSDVAMRPRESLGPRPGHYWYLPDYSQIEVWLFAFFSQSEIMLEALLEGADMHGRICKEVWGDEPDFEERYDYYRKCGKLVMFSKLYGAGMKKLAQQLQCTISEAKVFNALYEKRMPDIRPFFTRMQNLVFKEGTIQNIYGRYSDIPDHLAYKAVNYIIQGTAAEVMKESIIITWDYKEKNWPLVKLLMSLHDEMILEVPESYHSKELMRGVIKCMQEAGEPIGLPIPLKIGMKMVPPGGCWANAKEVKV